MDQTFNLHKFFIYFIIYYTTKNTFLVCYYNLIIVNFIIFYYLKHLNNSKVVNFIIINLYSETHFYNYFKYFSYLFTFQMYFNSFIPQNYDQIQNNYYDFINFCS